MTAGTAPDGLLSFSNQLLVPWVTAVGEELVFRAVLFRLTEEMLGTSAAVLISAALFGLSHAFNPGADPATLTGLALGLGALLALVFAATRSLWFPIGLHMGWNLAQAFVFGLANSGLSDPVQLARTSLSGHPLVTGGSFGPEGSVILVALCMVASALLIGTTLRAQRWTPMRPRLRQPVGSA